MCFSWIRSNFYIRKIQINWDVWILFLSFFNFLFFLFFLCHFFWGTFNFLIWLRLFKRNHIYFQVWKRQLYNWLRLSNWNGIFFNTLLSDSTDINILIREQWLFILIIIYLITMLVHYAYFLKTNWQC